MKKVGIHKRGEITLEDILGEARRSVIGKAGAIGCFIGIVREVGLKGGKVRFLEYEAYPEIVEDQLDKIRSDVMKKWSLIDLMIHHIVDRVPVGEDILYIVAAGKHRKEVFRALEETVDRLKEEVAIWKKEVTEEGAYWVSEEGISKLE